MYSKTVQRILEDKGFHVQDYYQVVSEYTSKTIFIDLEIEEAKAITNIYQQRNRIKKQIVKQEDCNNIIKLQRKINQTLKQYKIQRFFLRLSLRSPKDGQPYDSSQLKQLYTNQIKSRIKQLIKIKKITQSQITDLELGNIKLCSYFRVMEIILACETSKQAINLLTTSQRILTDIKGSQQLITVIPENKWNTKLVIRQWNDRMNGEWQFRCFIKNNNMRAISQYNHYIFIEAFQQQSVCINIRNLIYSYWKKQIKPRLQYLKDYIMDVAILDLLKQQICLIELNPYFRTTGPSLFYWDEKFLTQIQWVNQNQESVQIRVRSQILSNIIEYGEMKDEQINQMCSKKFNYEDFLCDLVKNKERGIKFNKIEKQRKCQIF